MIFELPCSVTSEAAYIALSAAKRRSIAERLGHALEVARVAASLHTAAPHLVPDELDGIELDALATLSNYPDIENSVSAYLVHSAWCTPMPLGDEAFDYVSSLFELLGRPPIEMATDSLLLRDWISRVGSKVVGAFSLLAEARTFESAVHFVVAIDSALGMMAAVVMADRLRRPSPL
ncbi:hypothetical protein [Roseateles sp. MS654]|uniref:hypothetical protein n=1 Tax=Roseateles sp. MS654 TaxID=3412685 RepID=UPI003C2D8F0E